MAAATHLFKNVQELQAHFPFDGTFEFWELQSDLALVEEKYLIDDIVGSETFAQVLEHIGEDSLPDATWIQFVEKLRAPAAKLLALYHLPEANVKYTAGGLMVTRNEKVAPASDNRKKDLELSLQHKSQDLLDMLLRFLEKNTAVFTDWAASEERKKRSAIFPTAHSFSEHYNISDNHWIFRKLQSVILDVEETYLTELIGEAYLTELRTEISSGTISEDNAKALKLIRPYLANITMAEAFPRLRISISPRGIIMFSNERGNYDEAFVPTPDSTVAQIIDKTKSAAAGFATRISDLLNTEASDTKYIAYKNGPAWQDPNIDVNDFGNDPDDPERIGYYAG